MVIDREGGVMWRRWWDLWSGCGVRSGVCGVVMGRGDDFSYKHCGL